MSIVSVDKIPTMPFDELLLVANLVRRKNCGRDIELCGIINAKSGACSEDCKFCAQSARYSVDIPGYPLKSDEEIVAAAKKAKSNGAKRFGIVTSGKRLSPDEVKSVAGVIRRITEEVGISLCASLGVLDRRTFARLKEAGLSRYHHNIETSGRYFPEIVSTHDHSERINTILDARKMGLEVCSGGILGMGETWQDRIEMALLLEELGVDSVPLNFLVPIKGTPMENAEKISIADAIRSIALFRIVLSDKTIKVVAGRESVLRDFQGLMYMAGANGMMVGGYLTTDGRSVDEDLALVGEIQQLWNEEE